MTGTATVATGATEAAVIGGGQTDSSTAVLCSLHFQAQERAGLLQAVACGSDGSLVEAQGVCAVDPDTGKLRLTGAAELSVDVNDNNRIDFAVAGGPGAIAWQGCLKVACVYDYSV